ncbi:uncharacterized protein K452DRAFT_316442 [Aplosporella prunicola CBS 121167]|uniref:Uncharacterized protein n=1 Tax=Aplosporella prunicola CBS 121167 TaxID=1176127 RepID=A0A6A6BK82_9PEZI|nr:uncharacterized protein K452DRAFT_316442 [Aplosporella prunicola CBS 121167]KAF2144446.1 hypothetical protein K452DRAFT_316442 [Aplosporella prunicola CBS 121167]
MASKLFTWTKGDRRPATDLYRVDGLVPVNACDNASDLGNASKRSTRKPHPLQLAKLDCFVPPSTIHNAAVTSIPFGSNLVTSFNDMLHSPGFNSPFLPSAPRKPVPGRRRSYTAPTTPIAELPGSLLQENQGFPDTPQASPVEPRLVISGNLALSSKVQRMRTAPGVANHRKSISLNSTAFNSNAHQLAPGIARSKGHSASGSVGSWCTSARSNRSREELSEHSNQSFIMPTPIPEDHSSGTNADNAFPIPQIRQSSQSSMIEQLETTIITQKTMIVTMRQQFVDLRQSYEAHVTSLTESHRKEIDACNTYMKVLEDTRNNRSMSIPLTIDTSTLLAPSPNPNTATASATTTRSAPTSFETSSRHSRYSGEELRKRGTIQSRAPSVDAQIEIRELRKELENANRQQETMNQQLEALSAKKNAYKDRAVDLETRLLSSQEQVVDLREAEYRLEAQRRRTLDYESMLKKELEAMRSKLDSGASKLHAELNEAKQRIQSLTAQLNSTKEQQVEPIAALTSQIKTLQAQAKEKDTQLYELRHTNEVLQLEVYDLDHRSVVLAAEHEEALTLEARKRRKLTEKAAHESSALKTHIAAQQRDLRACQAEYERLRKLLHAEMRKQAQDVLASGSVPAASKNAQIVAAEARRRVKALIQREEGGDGQAKEMQEVDLRERVRSLEKEIALHVSSIIGLKRDARGYRKEVKHANAVIERLHAAVAAADATPRPRLPAPPPKRDERALGLGIAATGSSRASSSTASGLGTTSPSTTTPPASSSASSASSSASTPSPSPSPSSNSAVPSPLAPGRSTIHTATAVTVAVAARASAGTTATTVDSAAPATPMPTPVTAVCERGGSVTKVQARMEAAKREQEQLEREQAEQLSPIPLPPPLRVETERMSISIKYKEKISYY